MCRLPIISGILFLLLFCGFVTAAKKNGAFYDKIWKVTAEECRTSDACKMLIPDENANCVNRCTSEKCYEKIYANKPLEDGEIDYDRNRAFTNCLREESRRKTGSRF